jgi:hypothetical protein
VLATLGTLTDDGRLVVIEAMLAVRHAAHRSP